MDEEGHVEERQADLRQEERQADLRQEEKRRLTARATKQ